MAADPIVLLHGLGVDGRMWNLQAPALRERATVYVPDMPGFGSEPAAAVADRTPEAYADWVAAGIRQRWPGGRVGVAGYSMGGTIALLLALRYPDVVSRLVVACSSPFWTRGWRQALRPFLSAPLARGAVEIFQMVVLWRFRHISRDGLLFSDLRDMVRKADRQTMIGLCRALALLDLRRSLRDVRAPALVVGGTWDFWLSASHAREMAGQLADGQVRIFPGAGHLLCVSHADEFSRVLGEFFFGEAGPTGP